MLAKFHILLPFTLIVPEKTTYNVYHYQDGDYQVHFDVPAKSDKKPQEVNHEIILNGRAAFQADVLTIIFKKESFERGHETLSPDKIFGGLDPSVEMVKRALDLFLERFRYVSKSPHVKTISLDETEWSLRYLNDDGSELEMQEGYFRGKSGKRFCFSYIACDPEIWDFVHALPLEFKVPPWSMLLVDAQGALPHIGSAITLAATALEVFIAEVLNNLVPTNKVSSEIWHWINEKEKKWQVPDVEEKYDGLLTILLGHSLKEDQVLWHAYQNIRTARNNFVHYGIARIGKGSTPLTVQQAEALIEKASSIITRVRDWLPKEIRWPMLEREVQIQGRFLISPQGNDPSSNVS